VVVRIGFVPVLVLFLALLGSCGEEAPKLTRGEPTPSFATAHLDGSEVQFPQQFAGRIVAIRFWADWCPFCESEMQAIEPAYRAYREQGLVILAVNVRQDRATAQAFVDKLNISYDTLLDTEGEVARAYGVLGLPTTFIIDRDGRLHSRIIGESTPQLFERIVQELL